MLLFEAQQKVPGLAQFLRDKSASIQADRAENDHEIDEMTAALLLHDTSESKPVSASAQPPPHSRDLPPPAADDSFLPEVFKQAELQAHRCLSLCRPRCACSSLPGSRRMARGG